MARTLHSEGILYTNLFAVSGPLVEYYNRALDKVTGKTTDLQAFHIDRRGKSPEIAAVLGNDYLQTGPSNRYMIVISPEQSRADLFSSEFSFDETAIADLYEQHVAGMSVVTRIDGLYGELNDGIRAYECIDDLLGIRSIEIRLHTPSGFITSARELKHKLEDLQSDPELLIKDNGAHVKRMIELVGEVGDIRGLPITNIETSYEVGAYSSTFFEGIHVFPSNGRKKPIKLKRPGKPVERGANGNGIIPQTTVIYDQKKTGPGEDENISYIPRQDLVKIESFLLDNGLAAHDEELVDKRLWRLEDRALAATGLNPALLSRPERQRALTPRYADAPKQWSELLALRKATMNGRFDEAIEEASPQTRIMLLTTHRGSEAAKKTTANLLAKLWPYDYETMLTTDPEGLEQMFAQATPLGQDAMIKRLNAVKAAKVNT